MEKAYDLQFSGANVKRTEIPRSGMTATGYGRRLATSLMVWHQDAWRRVYAICYSNAATIYIRVKGQELVLSDTAIDPTHADTLTQELR